MRSFKMASLSIGAQYTETHATRRARRVNFIYDVKKKCLTTTKSLATKLKMLRIFHTLITKSYNLTFLNNSVKNL